MGSSINIFDGADVGRYRSQTPKARAAAHAFLPHYKSMVISKVSTQLFRKRFDQSPWKFRDNSNMPFRNSEIVWIPIRYSDGQQLILSDNFGQIQLTSNF